MVGPVEHGTREGGRLVAVAHRISASGGMERCMREVVVGLLERGWHVTAVTAQDDLPAHPNLEVLRLRVPHRPFLLEHVLFAGLAAWRLRRLGGSPVVALGAIVPNRVDAVVLQYVHAASTTAREGRPPLSQLNQVLSGWLARTSERWCYRPSRLRSAIAVSPAIAAEFEAAYGGIPVDVVPNGVDPRHFRVDRERRVAIRGRHGIADERLVAVFVGGDWERKGLRPAIEAVAAAPAWSLIVVGRGARQTYEALAAELGCAERVVFAGPQDDVAPFFSAADAFVLPTRYEGFPLVSIEAAASGLPLVMTAAANAGDVLADGDSGWIVERSGPAVAQALRLLEDHDLRARFGISARSRAELLSWEHVSERHAAVYQRLAAPS